MTRHGKRGARAYNVCLGAEPGSGAKPTETETVLAFGWMPKRSEKIYLYTSQHFANSLLSARQTEETSSNRLSVL